MEIRPLIDNTYIFLEKRDGSIENEIFFIYAGIGYGKCIYLRDKDFIVSQDGSISNDVNSINNVPSLNNHLKLTNSEVIDKTKRSVNELLVLKTTGGKEICLTPEHPLLTINGWEQVQNLQNGDFIATVRDYNLNNTSQIDINLAKFLAYMIAEGYTVCQRRTVPSFTNTDDDLISDFLNSCKELFGDKIKIRKKENAFLLSGVNYFKKPVKTGLCNVCGEEIKKDGNYRRNGRGFFCGKKCQYEFKSNIAKETLRKYNLLGKSSGKKSIPEEIFKCNSYIISQFLKVLFSCDGGLERNRKKIPHIITYTSKSEKLIKQMSHLLLRFGILNRVSERYKYASNTKHKIKRKYHSISISDRNSLLSFHKNINFVNERKIKLLDELVEHKKGKMISTNVDVIPVKNKRWKNQYYSRDSINDSYDILKNSDIFWDKIKSIEKIKGKFEVEDICLRDNHNFVVNDIIIHNSLAMESLYEEFHRAGYTVIILSDVKKEFEFCYAMFKPQEKYHTDHLKHIGKPINPLDVKIYHPFTFSIPTRVALPEIQFYGLSLKRDLHREEWSMIAESDTESDTIRLLMNTSRAINRNEGLYPFLHKVEDSIITKKRKKMPKADPSNFYLRTTPATAKSLQDISSYLRPFLHDYFLVPDDSPLVLNWKEILNDNERIHCFTTKWIGDKKIEEFVILSLFNSIIKHKDLKKHPVLIVIPEIKELVPSDATRGYKKYLAQGIRDNLTKMRSMGKGGFSGLFDSQVWNGVEGGVRDMANVSAYGKLSDKDIELLAKALKYKTDRVEKLIKPDARNSYLIRGHEEDSFTLFFPGFMHCEQKYRFEEIYRDRIPNKMQNYSDLVFKMKKELKEQIDYHKGKVKKRDEEELASDEAKKKEREVKKTKGAEVEKLKKGKKEVEDKSREKDIIKVGEMKAENPELSWRKLADKCSCDPKTARKYYGLYLEKMESENVKDVEEKVLEELE